MYSKRKTWALQVPIEKSYIWLYLWVVDGNFGSWARLNAVESVCIILSIVHSDLLWVKSAFWLSKTGEKRIVPVRFTRRAHSVRFEIEMPQEDLRMSNELVILVIFLQSLFLVVERESIQTKRPPKHIHTLTQTHIRLESQQIYSESVAQTKFVFHQIHLHKKAAAARIF